MKKAVAILILSFLLLTRAWAFKYPKTLYGVFQQYRDLNSTVCVVTLYLDQYSTPVVSERIFG